MRVVKLTLIAAFLAAIATAQADYVKLFEQFKKDHQRAYPSRSEEAKRLGFFIRNMQRAEQLQAMNPHARFGANEFADMSEEEFKVRHNAEGFYRSAVANRKNRPVAEVKASASFAQTQDWRKHGVVTPVKNQGQCGSCWSFSTTGNIEGQWALAGNSLVSVSEQELVSCDTTCNGCSGGLMDLAFEWIVSAQGGGITGESQYPYVSGDGYAPACDMTGKTSVAFIKGHTDIPHDENSMAQWMSTGGPLSIGVDATSWQTYQGGIMTNCQSSQVDHGVLAVGYDLTNQPPYWIVKNSWGPTWGESGYIRVEFGQNQCLITTAPSSSIASGNHPPSPPSPPSPPTPPAPTPPSPTPPGPAPPSPPSTGSFTQYVCPGAFCLSDCTSHTFQTGVCLQLSGGGSAVATCGTFNLHLDTYTSSDCTGSSQSEDMALNVCEQDTSGSYVYNTCSASAAGVRSSSNVTLSRRH